MTQEQNELRLYSQICADAYGNGCNNSLSSDWEKLILVIDNRVSGEYYYDFKQIVYSKCENLLEKLIELNEVQTLISDNSVIRDLLNDTTHAIENIDIVYGLMFENYASNEVLTKLDEIRSLKQQANGFDAAIYYNSKSVGWV